MSEPKTSAEGEAVKSGKENDDSLKLANASGFLFQLRIEQEVERTRGSHGWSVAVREHRWVDQTGEERFIDLILERDRSRMVVECKRVKDAKWIFLLPEKEKKATQRFRVLWTYRKEGQKDLSGWSDFDLSKESPEAAFCIVRGQGEKDRPMLEGVAGIVLRSAEALAADELKIGPPWELGQVALYFPVIVTTADLQVCRFDPGTVGLADGQLPGAGADVEFETVPFIRFRKSLSTTYPFPRSPRDLSDMNKEFERSVFVVNATQMSSFLSGWEVHRPDMFSPGWPWDLAREER